MWLPRHQKGPQTLNMIILLLIISSFSNEAIATLSRKLDQEVLVPPNGQAPDYNNDLKCGACPCASPCGQLPPPPPLPLPLLPPPATPPPPSPPLPPPPPPPSPPPPKTPSCTPPPPPRFIYVTGVPGEVYQTEVNNWYSRAECNVVAKKLLLLTGYFALGILVI